MQKLFLLAAVLFSFTAAQAADSSPTAPAVPAQHPIVGSWSWTLPGKSCEETYQYSANGNRTGRSGDEATLSDYEISPLPSLLGFHKLVETVTKSNGKRDCSGDLHQAPGEPVTRFIQFSPKLGQLIVCKAESLQACFGPLKRVPG